MTELFAVLGGLGVFLFRLHIMSGGLQRDESSKSEAKRVEQAGYDLRRGLLYLDMMTNMEKIGDYCWNVVKPMQKSHDDE